LEELTLAFKTTSEDKTKLAAVPFKQIIKDDQLLPIKDKESFINSISTKNMPNSIIFDINDNLVFSFN
jgi:hypothetical protein